MPPRLDLSNLYDELARCNRCGFCQVACPIFRATGHEAGVARGRLALLRALVEGRLEWSSELEEPLFTCLLCGACTANCFPATATADLLTEARRAYLDRVGRKPFHRLLFNRLLPYPERLRRAARAAAFGNRSGLTKAARALGLLRIFGRDFPRAVEIADRLPARALRDTLPPSTLAGAGRSLRVAYFVGCGMDIMVPDAGRATVQALRAAAQSVTVLDNVCCGLPAETYGDRDAARRLAERNLALLARDEFDTVVTDCSSCAAFLKKYPRLFPENDPRHETARRVGSRVRDFVQWCGESEPPRRQATEPIVATWHDPCHAVRGQGLRAEPRRILQSLAGVEFRELPEADWCCGGAGSYALAHYDLARKVLERKIDNVERTSAGVVVTSCPACIIHLRYGIRLRGLSIRVCHLSEILVGNT